MYESLKTGCVDCGNLDIRVLEFDHVRGRKLANLATLVQRESPLHVIAEEIAKCEVRCRNCHAVATIERREVDWRKGL